MLGILSAQLDLKIWPTEVKQSSPQGSRIFLSSMDLSERMREEEAV